MKMCSTSFINQYPVGNYCNCLLSCSPCNYSSRPMSTPLTMPHPRVSTLTATPAMVMATATAMATRCTRLRCRRPSVSTTTPTTWPPTSRGRWLPCVGTTPTNLRRSVWVSIPPRRVPPCCFLGWLLVLSF